MNIDLLDKSLMFFYQNPEEMLNAWKLADFLYPELKSNSRANPKSSLGVSLIRKLEEDGYVYHYVHSSSYQGYRIAFDGMLFFEKAPRPLKNRPYRYTAIIDNIKQMYTIAKIIMAAISTLAIIWISYLTYAKDEIINVPQPKIIVHPTTTVHDTIFIDSAH